MFEKKERRGLQRHLAQRLSNWGPDPRNPLGGRVNRKESERMEWALTLTALSEQLPLIHFTDWAPISILFEEMGSGAENQSWIAPHFSFVK